jgi:hypothetical protein
MDGRVFMFAIVIGYFVLIGLPVVLLHVSLTSVWKSWGVPALNPHFGDLVGLIAGIENQDAGRGVGEPNPFDPWHRPYNNPALWLVLKYVGLNRQTEILFGIGFVALFFFSAFHVLKRLTKLQGVYAGLFLISPVVMTGVERGNVDLILFSLLAAALALRRQPLWATLILVLAGILKYHPVGALLALLSPPWRRTLPYLALALVLILVYELAHLKELAAVSAVAPHEAYFTFGSATFALWIAKLGGTEIINYPNMLIWSDVTLLAVAAIAFVKRPYIAVETAWERELFAFRIGAGIYLFSFALGANSDYRMTFFLFCLPLLFRLRELTGPVHVWANAALFCGLLYANWLFLSDEFLVRHMLLKLLLAWSLAASLAGLTWATLTWPNAWAINAVKNNSATPQT